MASEFSVYAIRLDASDPTDLLAFLEKEDCGYLAVKELEDTNPHFHVVMHTKKKIAAVRAALKRALPDINGNGSYSLSLVRELDKYVRYMCKGTSKEVGPDIVGARGLQYQTAEWIEEQHDAYWVSAEEIARKRDDKKVPIIPRVIDLCKEGNVRWSDRVSIAKLYIKELVSRDKAINSYAVRYAVNLIQIKLCPDDSAIDDLAGICGSL